MEKKHQSQNYGNLVSVNIIKSMAYEENKTLLLLLYEHYSKFACCIQ